MFKLQSVLVELITLSVIVSNLSASDAISDLSIHINDENVVLNWGDVEGAGFYTVNSSIDAYSGFDTIGVTSESELSFPINEGRFFDVRFDAADTLYVNALSIPNEEFSNDPNHAFIPVDDRSKPLDANLIKQANNYLNQQKLN
jgi:hypothetical protein